ncbi:MAG: hypothetical protein K8R59_18120 [Thermoanaerobaculales bacterium]|nr:hypothetical protein [Thermoanaerobaculales bacterium]
MAGLMRSVVVLFLTLLLSPFMAGAQIVLPDLPDTDLEISWQDFKALLEAAQKPPTTQPPPPRDAFLRSAEYRGRLEPGVIQLRGILRLEVLKSGWVSIPLWQRGISVLSFSGGGATLSRRGSGVEALVEGPGTFDIEVQLAISVPDNPGENRLSVVFPEAPINVVELRAGAGVEDLRAEIALVVSEGPGVLRFALASGQATVAWRRPFTRGIEAGGEEIEREPRVHVVSYELLDVGEGSLGGLLILDYQVRVAEVGHFDLRMPAGIEVFDVTAPGLESWKILRREQDRVLHLALAAPVEGALRAVVSFEGTYDAETGLLEAPRFAPLSIEREAGFVAISAEGAEVELRLGESVLPADPSEIPGEVQAFGGNAVVACKFSGAPGGIQVAVTEHADASVLTAVIERLNATTVVLEDGTEALWLDLGLKNNRKQFLKLALPDSEMEIWSLLVDGEPARPKRSDDTVLVPLPRGGRETSTSVSLVMLHQGPRIRLFRRTEPALPLFDVPVTEAMWTVYLPPDRRYKALRSPFTPVSETAPLIRSRPGGGWMMGVASSAGDYASAPVSEETVMKQKKQETDAFVQMKSRQGAMRRGALPVRINLPQGVTSLPKISAARILMVDETPVRLPIRVYPNWIHSLMTLVNVLAVAGAAFLLGVWRREQPRFLVAAALLLLLSLIVPGGPGVVGTLLLAGFLGACLQGARAVHLWWKARSRTASE